MPPLRLVLPVLLTLAAPSALWPQVGEEDYKVYTEHPRLLLPQRRSRLLRRERARKSLRWQQFDLLMKGGGQMPEPGFELALYAQVADDPSACRIAIDWALKPGDDLRQQALVFDWCQVSLSEAELKKLAGRLQKGIDQAAQKPGIAAVRDRVLAAIALEGHVSGISERQLKQVVETWWRGEMVPALKGGRDALPRRDAYALMEIFHAVRDNINIDLRDDAPLYFREWSGDLLVSYYPAPYPAAENEYRIPAVKGGQPNLDLAAETRASELALVAFDPNLQAHQFLQGWLIHDRFLMRSAYAIAYEFLWANPYQPGLSYYHMPLANHDPVAGRLFLRSSWEEDATWLGYFDGELQLFEEGEVKVLNPKRERKLVFLGDAVVLQGPQAARFTLDNPETKLVFVVGLEPRRGYELEIDDEEMREETTDAGGILRFAVTPRPGLGIRTRPSSHRGT